MSRESLRLLIIAAIVVAIIPLILLINWRYEATRAVLREVRVVSATSLDPVFRDGSRHLEPDETLELAVALNIGRGSRGDFWMAPVPRLELDGQPVEHVDSDLWPESDWAVRAFWFTIECNNPGPELTAADAAQKLAYRSFLAPELGRGMRAKGSPEVHNDDHYSRDKNRVDQAMGTQRLYARVEVVRGKNVVSAPLQVQNTVGADQLFHPDMAAFFRSGHLPEGIRPETGELFLLPGFEPVPEPGSNWNQVTMAGLGKTFTALVEHRLVCSSQTLAAVAVSGSPELHEARLRSLGLITATETGWLGNGQALRWQHEVLAGDLLVAGEHWMVLASDDGDGLLDDEDQILHCWRRPPALLTLDLALDDETRSLAHLRHEQ